MMESEDALLRIQSAYPRIYLACHSRHQKSQRDGTLLAHLSEQNNTPDVARRNMARALAKTAFRGQLSVASQYGVVGPFGPRGARRESPLQLALF